MFTGIVEGCGTVVAVQPQGPGVRLVLQAPEIRDQIQIGDSVSVSGCCLTVVQIETDDSDASDAGPPESRRSQHVGQRWHFDAGEETLRCTNLGRLAVGSRVNLERSLAVGDRMGGHFVTGHVDFVGTLLQRDDDADWSTFWIRVPDTWTRQMAAKGSVTVDGVSLTLVDVEQDRFSLALIPHTLDVTTLGKLAIGDPVNVETDVLAKYVERLSTFSID